MKLGQPMSSKIANCTNSIIKLTNNTIQGFKTTINGITESIKQISKAIFKNLSDALNRIYTPIKGVFKSPIPQFEPQAQTRRSTSWFQNKLSNENYVHTLGDSTLDNVYWMLDEEGKNIDEAKAKSVEGQLQTKLILGNNETYKVVSHAYDGFTTSSLCDGDRIGRVLHSENPDHMDPKAKSYLKCKGINPNADTLHIKPLDNLKAAILKKPNATHYVVLSVGGNDFREQLRSPIKMLQSIPAIIERHRRIMDEIKQIQTLHGRNIKPILMFQYKVDANNDSYLIYLLLKVIGVASLGISLASTAALAAPLFPISTTAAGIFFVAGLCGLVFSNSILPLRMIKNVLSGQEIRVAVLGALMEKFYQPILKYAKDQAIPILDLPNTFNPYKKLYLAGIEPGVEGGKLIAEGIDHIVKNHDYNSSSKLYAKTDSLTKYAAFENPGYHGWRVRGA